jgi:aryl-alcohol dehydrogenase-like predicted oxidoreductase
VSSIGLGTYLGDNTDEDDAAYESAVRHAVGAGVNLIDTAINYRSQRSELAIGAAIQQLSAAGHTTREELVICTKGGYIPLDRTPPATREEYQAYVKREFTDQEIVHPDEIVAGGHSLAPRFLRYCLAKSRQNLGVRTIDVYYIHNPGQQLASVGPDELRRRLQAAFGVLEEAVSRAEIQTYGLATWDELRTPPGERGHVSLSEAVDLARGIAGDGHHFRAVQVPINLAMPEAVRSPTQIVGDKLLTVLEAASELGLTVFGSATLMQSKLASGLTEGIRAHFPGFATDAQRAIAFSRTIPGVTAALVGMKRIEHVDENIGSALVHA